MAERAGDTRTQSPCIYSNKPWELELGANLGLDTDVEQLTASGNVMWQQNFKDVSYYVSASYGYQSLKWKTFRHRATGTFRTDIHVADLSDTLSLSIPFIATAAYDTALKLEPRITAGGGLWLDYKDPKKIFYNGISLFLMSEVETGGELRSSWTPRFSLREFFKIKAGDTVKIMADIYYTPAMNDFSNFRVSAIPSLDVDLDKTGTFSLKIGSVIEYTSMPRDPSVKKLSVSGTLGFGAKIGHKE